MFLEKSVSAEKKSAETQKKGKTRRNYIRPDYPAKNLRFLVEFFNRLGITSADYEKIGHGSAQALRTQFRRDDMKISRAMQIVEDLGYRLTINLVPKEQDNTPTVIEDDSYSITFQGLKTPEEGPEEYRPQLVRLHFIEELLHRKKISQRKLAQMLDYSFGAIQAWLRTDDMFISHVNTIKDKLGMKVEYIIDTPEEDGKAD